MLLDYIGLRGASGPIKRLNAELIERFGTSAELTDTERKRANQFILLFARKWNKHFKERGSRDCETESESESEPEPERSLAAERDAGASGED